MESDEERLVEMLAVAAEKLAMRSESILSEYASGKEIAQFVRECIELIRADDLDSDRKPKLWTIFAPTCDWDDVIGDLELGHQIFEILSEVRRARESAL